MFERLARAKSGQVRARIRPCMLSRARARDDAGGRIILTRVGGICSSEARARW